MMARADRIATLYLFSFLRRVLPSAGVRIPILMYHSLSDSCGGEIHPYYETATSPRVFAQHMRYLHEHRYKVLSLADAVRRLETPGTKSDRPVVITFDDGYQDFRTQAFPVLQQYGFGATVFLPTAFVGDTPLKFKGLECLTWGQARELHRSGIAFGSHTVSHPQLTTLKPHQVDFELRHSKEVIEDKLNCPVESFAYPYAFPEIDRAFKQRLRTILKDAGYRNGVSTIIGRAGGNGGPFFLKRLPMNSYDDPLLFRAKVEGGYDWLHGPQLLSKLIADLRQGRKN